MLDGHASTSRDHHVDNAPVCWGESAPLVLGNVELGVAELVDVNDPSHPSAVHLFRV
jgi:hypothetical protein